MKTSTIIGIVIVVIVVIGGIWWYMQQSVGMQTSSATDQTSTVTNTGTPAPSMTPILTQSTSDTIGNYLTAAGNGMTLYTFGNDTPGTSTCTGTCATTWPPYTVASASDVAPDANFTGTLGTITRDDGTLQVTYNGMPLHFYSHDTTPGDTNGTTVANWSIAKP